MINCFYDLVCARTKWETRCVTQKLLLTSRPRSEIPDSIPILKLLKMNNVKKV